MIRFQQKRRNKKLILSIEPIPKYLVLGNTTFSFISLHKSKYLRIILKKQNMTRREIHYLDLDQGGKKGGFPPTCFCQYFHEYVALCPDVFNERKVRG